MARYLHEDRYPARKSSFFVTTGDRDEHAASSHASRTGWGHARVAEYPNSGSADGRFRWPSGQYNHADAHRNPDPNSGPNRDRDTNRDGDANCDDHLNRYAYRDR